MDAEDIRYMKLAMIEAKKGVGRTSPNPPVGAVVVRDGEVVSTGFHESAGEPHAEIIALKKAGERAYGATLYVTLEPCNHYGKTPPCTKAILKAGIRKVVYSCADPVAGHCGGGLFLRESGVIVTEGILKNEGEEILRPFLSVYLKDRPYILLKMGMTLDGKIYRTNRSGYITSDESLHHVHELRNEFDAVMIGGRTARIDNPRLDCRGVTGGRDGVKIVIDPTLKNLSPELKLFQKGTVIVVTGDDCDKDRLSEIKSKSECFLKFIIPNGDIFNKKNLSTVMKEIATYGVSSILLEGGSYLAGQMLHHHLVDSVKFFYNSSIAGNNGTLSAVSSITGDDFSDFKIKIRALESYVDDFVVSGDVIYKDT
ncbi:MAG: bifunctional diaminohydroxyphosphoribosylaminopyrimidine deaminase/5-amino-6-(5-phosphoribosylamino)uracil reductase RibD [Deltaproteobacteria bacterium]|nr:bifunctional diaminohydroxyphosphoribosylaminopyrimidine deaminase/5-amino-6-(5-phosphoribosylamino)uracil reductase RibD [Deltaproteobacteria bacterium]